MFFLNFVKAAIGADLSVHPDGDMTLDENEDEVAGYVEVSPSVVAGANREADVHRLGFIESSVPAFSLFKMCVCVCVCVGWAHIHIYITFIIRK